MPAPYSHFLLSPWEGSGVVMGVKKKQASSQPPATAMPPRPPPSVTRQGVEKGSSSSGSTCLGPAILTTTPTAFSPSRHPLLGSMPWMCCSTWLDQDGFWDVRRLRVLWILLWPYPTLMMCPRLCSCTLWAASAQLMHRVGGRRGDEEYSELKGESSWFRPKTPNPTAVSVITGASAATA